MNIFNISALKKLISGNPEQPSKIHVNTTPWKLHSGDDDFHVLTKGIEILRNNHKWLMQLKYVIAKTGGTEHMVFGCYPSLGDKGEFKLGCRAEGDSEFTPLDVHRVQSNDGWTWVVLNNPTEVLYLKSLFTGNKEAVFVLEGPTGEGRYPVFGNVNFVEEWAKVVFQHNDHGAARPAEKIDAPRSKAPSQRRSSVAHPKNRRTRSQAEDTGQVVEIDGIPRKLMQCRLKDLPNGASFRFDGEDYDKHIFGMSIIPGRIEVMRGDIFGTPTSLPEDIIVTFVDDNVPTKSKGQKSRKRK